MLALVPHPVTRVSAVASVHAGLTRIAARTLRLRYELRGAADRCQWPAPAAEPARRDGLWQHSCCELFLHTSDAPFYLEYNFAPCGDWATYAFASYRLLVTEPLEPTELPAPRIRAGTGDDSGALWLEAELELPEILLPGARAGLCVVVESAPAHALSYWALAHPRAQPDFHDASGHVFEIDTTSATGSSA